MTIRSWLSPLSGFSALIQGLKWLKHPQLRMLIVLPIVINVVIYGLVLGLGLHWTAGLMADLIAWLPDWLSFLGTLFWWLMLFMLLAVLGLTFVTAALIISAPFYGQ
ncbi:MAG: sulfate transporter CysZ, partial [Proteobacteria bacterium]|nr:sulfate transporter CysZ [Pseudomonadota bacterium]